METQPALLGARVLALRDIATVRELQIGIESEGGHFDAVPAITTIALPKWERSISNALLTRADGIIFTSHYATEIVLATREIYQKICDKKIICIGPKTAAPFLNAGYPAHNIRFPSTPTSAAIMEDFSTELTSELWIHPRSQLSTTDWLGSCRSVYPIAIYTTLPLTIAINSPLEYDYVIHFSGSVARSFFNQFPTDLPQQVHLAIGQQTLRYLKCSNKLISDTPTQRDIIKKIIDHRKQNAAKN